MLCITLAPEMLRSSMHRCKERISWKCGERKEVFMVP